MEKLKGRLLIIDILDGNLVSSFEVDEVKKSTITIQMLMWGCS